MDLPQPADVLAEKYEVERELGRGGMGAVYVVRHRLTGKRLALKCLLPELLCDADLVERFLREAQATGRIEHRNVINVFDVGRDGPFLYLVMELLDGMPLSALLCEESLTLEETLAILVRAMEGVAAAHAQGVIHRDLKPDNIFVCRGAAGRCDDPRVLDFGISKIDGESMRLTRSGVTMGTPYYMPLEQLSGDRDLDARVDVYAMGVILYEAIAGVPPHMADSMAALIVRVLTTAPTPLRELRPDLPAGLSDVVMRAIAKDREQRYPSMDALIEAVRPFVPKGAGLLVPEGQGRPLRTPRGTRSDTGMPSAVSHVTTRAPRNAPPAAVPATAPTQHNAQWRTPALLGVAAVTVAGALLIARAYLADTPQPVSSDAPRPPAAADAASGAPSPSSPKQTTPTSAANDTSQLNESAQAVPPSPRDEMARDAGTDRTESLRTSRSSGPDRVGPSKPAAARRATNARTSSPPHDAAPSRTADTQPQPAATTPNREPPKVRGRAGQLSTDDF